MIIQLTITPPSGPFADPLLPRAAAADTLGFERAPDVSIDRQGLIYLDTPNPVPDHLLARRISTMRARGPALLPLMLAANQNVPYGRILDVVDAAAAAGEEEVVLMTDPRPPVAAAEGM